MIPVNFKVGKFYQAVIPQIFTYSKASKVLFRLKNLTYLKGNDQVDVPEATYEGGNELVLHIEILKEDPYEASNHLGGSMNAGFFEDVIEVPHLHLVT